ncbi:MAG: glucose-6-phosphate dehydrogenase assembly protein OpcA [Solirubrobacteraceae bacterium]
MSSRGPGSAPASGPAPAPALEHPLASADAGRAAPAPPSAGAEDLWSARDTTPEAIDTALRELLRERHRANHALAPARVLNLVVIVDREWKGEIANRLARVGRYHASRTVLCSVQDGRRSLDARAVMSYEEPAGELGVMREQVEIDLGPEHLPGLENIVDPVVVSELPTVLWSPHGHEEAVQALTSIVDVMLIDSDDGLEPTPALTRAFELLHSAYVVDLAWLRSTPWRERLAASFDRPRRRRALERISEIEVRHHPSSTASALLLAGWLASRLRWDAQSLDARRETGLSGVAGRAGDQVAVALRAAPQDAPGLGGVMVSCEDGFSLCLARAPGGLQVEERCPDGGASEWQLLGASRGEGGILGEGVRQALLRDPTYGPALDAALGFCPR